MATGYRMTPPQSTMCGCTDYSMNSPGTGVWTTRMAIPDQPLWWVAPDLKRVESMDTDQRSVHSGLSSTPSSMVLQQPGRCTLYVVLYLNQRVKDTHTNQTAHLGVVPPPPGAAWYPWGEFHPLFVVLSADSDKDQLQGFLIIPSD